MKLGNYVAYISVSITWLIMELSVAQYMQYSGAIIFFAILINVASMVIASYRPAYHTYLFTVNTAVMIYIGYTLPSNLATAYSMALSITIIMYLLLNGLLKPLILLISVPIIYVSYIVEKALLRTPITTVLSALIGTAGINSHLFILVLSWYLSLFIVLIIIVLLVLLIK